jgi:hypothetical protein
MRRGAIGSIATYNILIGRNLASASCPRHAFRHDEGRMKRGPYETRKRALFKLLAAGSFALLAALAVLWVRSYWRGDTVKYEARWRDGTHSVYRRLYVTSSGGGIAAARTSLALDDAFVVPPRVVGLSAVRPSPTRPPRDWSVTSYANPGYPFKLGVAVSPAHHVGFQFYHARPSAGPNFVNDEWRLVMPHWFPVLAAAVVPVAWLSTRWRNRRRLALAAGRCARCGYDLRGTPERCPECGTPSEPLPSAPAPSA